MTQLQEPTAVYCDQRRNGYFGRPDWDNHPMDMQDLDITVLGTNLLNGKENRGLFSLPYSVRQLLEQAGSFTESCEEGRELLNDKVRAQRGRQQQYVKLAIKLPRAMNEADVEVPRNSIPECNSLNVGDDVIDRMTEYFVTSDAQKPVQPGQSEVSSAATGLATTESPEQYSQMLRKKADDAALVKLPKTKRQAPQAAAESSERVDGPRLESHRIVCTVKCKTDNWSGEVREFDASVTYELNAKSYYDAIDKAQIETYPEGVCKKAGGTEKFFSGGPSCR